MRSTAGLTSIAFVALLVAACSVPTAAPGPPSPAPTAPQAAGTPAVQAPARPTGTLRVATSAVARTLDPLAMVGTPSGSEPGTALADSLLYIARDGSLVPLLAERWQAPTDGVTWTFKLNPSARFSDGSPVTAQDVKHTFDAFLNPANNYSQAARISAFLAGTEAVDPATFVIRTRAPDAILPRRIASILILQARSYNEIGLQGFTQRQPIGSGQYVTRTYEPNQRLVIEANPNAWRPTRILTVEFRGIAEEAVRLGALKTGELDLVSLIPESAEEAKKDGKQVHTLQNASNTAILIDSASPDSIPAFKDRRVRQALNLSLDRANLVRALTLGYGRPSSVAVAPEAFGYIDLPMYPFDPARARQLVQEAGFAGITTRLTGVFGTGAGLATRTGVEAISQQLSQSGIRVDLEGLETAIFLQRYSGGGLAPLMIFPLGAAGNDADGAILNFRTETNPVPATIRYTNPEFDRLYLASRVEFDQEKRRKLLQDALKLLYDDYALIPVGNVPSIWGLQPKVQGFNPNSTFNWNWSDMSVQ